MSIVKAEKKSVKKSAKEQSNSHGRFFLGCSLGSKDAPKLFLDLYLTNKRFNVKFKIYLELSFFLCHLANFDRTPQPLQAIYSYNINSCWSIINKLKKSLSYSFLSCLQKK